MSQNLKEIRLLFFVENQKMKLNTIECFRVCFRVCLTFVFFPCILAVSDANQQHSLVEPGGRPFSSRLSRPRRRDARIFWLSRQSLIRYVIIISILFFMFHSWWTAVCASLPVAPSVYVFVLFEFHVFDLYKILFLFFPFLILGRQHPRIGGNWETTNLIPIRMNWQNCIWPTG